MGGNVPEIDTQTSIGLIILCLISIGVIFWAGGDDNDNDPTSGWR